MSGIEITQADREAAVEAVRCVVDDGFVVGCCVMSPTDGDEMAAYLSEAFARHRIEARAAAIEECAKVAGNFLMVNTGLAVEYVVELKAAIRALNGGQS